MDRLTATNRLNDGGRLLVENPQAADLDVPLTNSIIPQRGVGSVTYTRATIATVTDHEGVIRDCIAGEARFQGARRVRNLHTYSEDITNAVWNAASCTRTKNAGIAPDGTNTAGLVTSNAATALTEFNQNYSIVSGRTYILSVYLKANGGLQYVQLVGNGATFGYGYINIDLSNGTITANVPGAANMQATVTPEANGFYRIQLKAIAISTLANNHLSVAMIPFGASIRTAAFPGDGIKGFYYWHPQFEDVTGQSVQTAAEYVSTNVLTTAPFHGSNVDGVKYFDTDLNGTPIPASTLKGYFSEGARTNLFINTEDLSLWPLIGLGAVTGNATIGPDGRMTATLFTLGATVGLQGITQIITTTAAVHAQSIYVKPNGQNYIQCNAAGGISTGYVNFDLSNGTVGSSYLWTGTIESCPNGWYRLKVITNTIYATTSNVSFAAVPSATASRGQTMAGTGTSGFYLAKPQFELGPSVSSYIPTAGTTVTRNIDVLTYDVRNAIANQGAFSAVFSMDDDLAFDRRALNFSGPNNNRLHFQVRRSGLPYTNVSFGDGAAVRSVLSTQNAGTNNIAVAWTNGVSVNMYMNNTKYSSANIPNLIFSMIDVGGGANFLPIFGCIRDLRIWKTRPTDAELLILSNQS